MATFANGLDSVIAYPFYCQPRPRFAGLRFVGSRQAARQAAALLLPILLAGCGGFNLWPFADGPQGRDPAPPPNATAYRCDGGKQFYVRMLAGGAAWVILPEREFRLDKTAGAEGRYSSGAARLEIKADEASLSDGSAQGYTGCRVPAAGALAR